MGGKGDGKHKRPKQGEVPASAGHGIAAPARVPRAEAYANPEYETPVWRFGMLDYQGPWGWYTHDHEDVRTAIPIILDRLVLLEKITWMMES